ncbi:hypothetical protein RIF23_04990 [Lipingzhangella sp. LS1_29]|uniref:Uncharacterized protein n=1 Tax=Lipingzhangella rawalii TaxID=2055835 RepID=A0ABU2H488_9ACTN|nr:hypothetical protein [Lipingzhangella rawalii]MDS1269645.1 hypothetical protein [Lipingzhangella rawalii]
MATHPGTHPPPLTADPRDPRPTVGTHVQGTAENVNSGSGTQVNLNVSLADMPEEQLRELLRLPGTQRRRRQDGVLTAQDVTWHTTRFVAPRGFPALSADTTPDSTTLYLTGPSGSGRWAASLYWLTCTGATGAGIRQVRDSETEDGPQEQFFTEPPEEGELLLLDLRGVGSTRLSRLATELPGFQREVQSANARLAIVLRPEQQVVLGPEASGRTVHIHAPDATAVVRSHLRHGGLPADETVLASAEAQQLLVQATAGQAAELAELTVQAHIARHGRAGFAECFTEAQASFQDWSEALHELLHQHSSTTERTVLLAAAVCAGMPLEQVHRAAQGLLAQVRAPDAEEPPPLERAGLTTLLRRLGVTVHPSRRVSFPKLNYAAAIRHRFWDDHPDLHPVFVTWLSSLVRDTAWPQRDRNTIAGRLAEMCLRGDRLDLVLGLVQSWTPAAKDNESGHTSEPEAVLLLTSALTDPTAGREVRRQLYQWSRDRDLPGARARVATLVCARVLHHSHPRQAIVRLLHLARADSQSARFAEQELVDLVRDPPSRWLALRQLTHRETPRPRDWELFARITAPEVLAADGGAFPRCTRERDAFLTCAERAMRTDPEAARLHTRRWLAAAATDSRWRHMLDLVLRAGRTAGRTDVLYATARRWVLAAPDAQTRAERREPALSLIGELRCGRSRPDRSEAGSRDAPTPQR